MAPDAIHDSEIANLTQALQEAQDDFARTSAELTSAQAQVEWLESQASGVDTEELLQMMDTKDHALEEKDTEIERLASKLEEANRTAKRHQNEERHQEDLAMTLRQQVDSLATENRRLTREKQMAEAMKFATETKMEALEEKSAKAEGEAATLQRQLAAASKKGGGEIEEIAQQLSEMRDEMTALREQRQEASTKAETLASENVALRARAKTYDMFPGLGAPTRSIKAMEMVAEVSHPRFILIFLASSSSSSPYPHRPDLLLTSSCHRQKKMREGCH